MDPDMDGDVNNRASAVLEHRPTLRLARQEHSGDVDLDHSPPLAQTSPRGAALAIPALLTAEAERAEFALGVPHRIGEDVGIHDIAWDRDRSLARHDDLVADLFQG